MKVEMRAASEWPRSYPGRFLPFLYDCNWPISAGQSHTMYWSNPMQTTGQVECKLVVNCDENGWASGMQFPTHDFLALLVMACCC